MDDTTKTALGAGSGLAISIIGVFFSRFFKRGEDLKALSERVVKLETTVEKHTEQDEKAFAAINDRFSATERKLDSIHSEITDRFDRLTDLILKGKK